MSTEVLAVFDDYDKAFEFSCTEAWNDLDNEEQKEAKGRNPDGSSIEDFLYFDEDTEDCNNDLLICGNIAKKVCGSQGYNCFVWVIHEVSLNNPKL